MFNRKSIYALNKKDPDAIVYMDANEVIIRLTREDFASEEEFLKWKSWSDGNYHTEDNQDVVEGKHNTSMRLCGFVSRRRILLSRLRDKVSRGAVPFSAVTPFRFRPTPNKLKWRILR